MSALLAQIHLQAIQKAAARKRVMICFRADGTEIERRNVPSCARMSMQAASDHRQADKAKTELGDALDHVLVPMGTKFIALEFINGLSRQRGSLIEYEV